MGQLLGHNYLGFLKTRMTESPRRNILLMNLSLLTGLEPFLPLPVFGICSKVDCGQQSALHKHFMPNQAGAANATMQDSGSAGKDLMPGQGQQVRTSAQGISALPPIQASIATPLSTSLSHSPGSCCNACQMP